MQFKTSAPSRSNLLQQRGIFAAPCAQCVWSYYLLTQDRRLLFYSLRWWHIRQERRSRIAYCSNFLASVCGKMIITSWRNANTQRETGNNIGCGWIRTVKSLIAFLLILEFCVPLFLVLNSECKEPNQLTRFGWRSFRISVIVYWRLTSRLIGRPLVAVLNKTIYSFFYARFHHNRQLLKSLSRSFRSHWLQVR